MYSANHLWFFVIFLKKIEFKNSSLFHQTKNETLIYHYYFYFILHFLLSDLVHSSLLSTKQID